MFIMISEQLINLSSVKNIYRKDDRIYFAFSINEETVKIKFADEKEANNIYIKLIHKLEALQKVEVI